jgi:hypothetical protein
VWSSNSTKTSAVCPHRMLGPHVSGDSAALICDTSHLLSVAPIEHSLARPPTAPGLHLLYTDKRSSRRVGASSVSEFLSRCTTSFASWLQAVTGGIHRVQNCHRMAQTRVPFRLRRNKERMRRRPTFDPLHTLTSAVIQLRRPRCGYGSAMATTEQPLNSIYGYPIFIRLAESSMAVGS